MARIDVDARLPLTEKFSDWRYRLNAFLRDVAVQMNAVSEGNISGVTNAATAAPTAGTHRQGDFIRNQTPTVQGAPGSQYVLFGWICVASGTPGTFAQCRFLTGT